jgi:hypothetical protein
MTAQVVSAVFTEQVAFSAFVEDQLSRGRAVVPWDLTVTLFDEVILRVLADGQSHDIVATVAHPALPGANGVTNVGLAVSLRPEDHRKLAELRSYFGVDSDISDTELELSLDLDLDVEGEIAPQVERPSLEGLETDPARSLEDLDCFFGAPLDLEGPAPYTPIQADVLQDLIESRAPQKSVTASGLFHTDLAAVQRGSVDAMIVTALNAVGGSAEPPLNAGEASDGARYRALYPDKALRADDYYQAAMADARNGSFELARTNVNLAVAYNPTVPAYRELLDDVEQRLGVRVR